MQGDGNFVLYVSRHWIAKNALWSSGTCGRGTGPYRLVMQDDGNLVVYDTYGVATWASDTCRKGSKPHRLIMQDDGNLVVYDGGSAPTWASGTCR